MPEQRSSGVHSRHGECDRSSDNPVPVCGFPDRFFDLHTNFDPLQSFIEPSAILCDMLRLLERVPTSFNVFRARSLKPAWISRNVDGTATHVPLWPVPPPLWRWTGNSSPGRKQRSRRRLHHVKCLLLQRIVCMLNWIVLGYPDTPSRRAQAGEPISEEQVKVLDTLAGHISHVCNHGRIARADLGRFGEKFGALQSAAEELPDHLEVDLESILREISDSMSSYVKREKPHFAEQSKHDDDHSQCHHVPKEVVMPNVTNKPVFAKRIKWKHPPAFDARPFLVDPIVAAVYETPDSLRMPSYQWPKRSKARVHCDRSELLELMKIWDAHGSLALFPCHEVDPQETVGLFAVPKDENFDRLIINPTVLNSRMMPYSNFTRKLAPGVLLGLLSLGPKDSFRFCADDLSDFYYTFKVSRARAKRNCIGTVVHSSEVRSLQCFDNTARGPFYPALATLAMGDSHAVEIAQGSHFSLLQLRAGCMRDSETLQYRKPIPRGDFFELLAIDDHIGVQRIPTSELSLNKPSRDTLVFEQANRAYSEVGLVSHPGKQRRFETQGTLLGADFDGKKGVACAPRPRVLLLAWVTAVVCKKGTCTRQLLSSIVGCWIHVVLFRRPLLSLMDALFKEISKGPSKHVVCLSSQCRHELMSLCFLGFSAQADLRATFCPKVYALDASPWGAGIVVADSCSTATAEFWRHSEQRGYHTNLLSPAGSTLKELGMDPISDLETGWEDFGSSVPEAPSLRIPHALSEGILYDCVELFRGSGNWSSCHQQQGFVVHDGFDNSGRRLFFKDLLDNHTFKEVLALALRRVVREFHAGPPCVTFGTLRRPRLRNCEHPSGFNPNDPLTASHNILARRTAMVGTVAVITGAYFSCEQTGSSVMFRMHCFRVLIYLGCVITRMAFCNFGSGFNKPSQWLHNKGWLLEFEGPCKCPWKGKHFTIEGTFTKSSIAEFQSRCVPSAMAVYGRDPMPGEAVASYSAQYPVSLMSRMAHASRTAVDQGNPIIPHSARLLSFKRVGLIPDVDPLDLVSPEISYEPRAWYEDPEWIGELADSLSFRKVFQYHFKERNHINVQESRVYASWIKHCAKAHRDSRFVGLLDSRVTIGAASKGRSSSYAISRVLKQTIPYILGSNLYPGTLHVYSSQNRGDGPSRDKAIAAPSKEPPRWYLDLCRGDYSTFDITCQAAQFPKNAARWLRMLLLLAGDIERNPGPAKDPRGELDLGTGFHKATADRMHRCLAAFRTWVISDLRISWEGVMSQPDSCAFALRAYGMHLFRTGQARYRYVYTLTAVQDRFPQFRQYLGAAWQIDKKWQLAEPGACRPVMPISVFRASLCIGLLWGWVRWVGVTLLAYAGMLHPAEFLELERRDLMLPSDTCYTTRDLYIHLRNPKTARFARQQHVKISDPEILLYAVKVFGRFPLNEKLYGATISAYRNQWNCIMSKLGVPYRQTQKGMTPGTLRGSGATRMYLDTENIPLILWRGRWARLRTLEFYLQEVSAQVFTHSLSQQSQQMIRRLHTACPRLFHYFLHEVCS